MNKDASGRALAAASPNSFAGLLSLPRPSALRRRFRSERPGERTEDHGPASLASSRPFRQDVFMSQRKLASALERHDLDGDPRDLLREFRHAEREYQAPWPVDLEILADVLDVVDHRDE